MTSEPHKLIWLASYPRSGNTLLRIVLRQCFGLFSESVYVNDLGGNRELEKYVGHIEHSRGESRPESQSIQLVKTHERPMDDRAAIYVVRNGLDASISLRQFYGDAVSFVDIVTGRLPFGTWADHLAAWSPGSRANTLLLRYESLVADLPACLDDLTSFLGAPVLQARIPSRDVIASVDGMWVRPQGRQTHSIPRPEWDLFRHVNGRAMDQMDYPMG